MPSNPSKRREAGFTLLEVLVAFTIFALSFTAILQLFTGSLRNGEIADRALIALGHAESFLARAGAEHPLAEGERRGELPGGMSWTESIAHYSDPLMAGALAPAGMQPYSVTVTVTWGDGSRKRDVTLTTLRLGGAS